MYGYVQYLVLGNATFLVYAVADREVKGRDWKLRVSEGEGSERKFDLFFSLT